ncbi:MAG: hypothetical protein H8E40_03855 [Chloroflexi bacterium]|nr:hypothetical protein [Chloroflexota bacterium]
MKITFEDISPVAKQAADDLVKLVESTGEIRFRNRRDVSFSRQERYSLDIFLKSQALLQRVSTTEEALRYIQRVPSFTECAERDITQRGWFEYHYSHYVIAVVSLYDIALILVNAVLQLGNPDRLCRSNIIKSNQWVRDTDIGAALVRLERSIQPYKEHRNLQVHRGDSPNLIEVTQSENLDLANLVSFAQSSSDTPLVEEKFLDLVYSHEAGQLSNELQSQFGEVGAALSVLLDHLLPIYKKGVAMSKSTPNTGKRWNKSDIAKLKQFVRENTPTPVIGLKLGRTEAAIRAKASRLNISLKPTNRPPYNR